MKETLSAAEISEIPPEKLDNYINCVKIITNVVEYIRVVTNAKLREKEAVVFIASFIKICCNAQGRDNLACIMSILRFRKLFPMHHMKKICTYIKRISEDITDSNHKQILNSLVNEIDAMNEDKFGVILSEEVVDSQESVKMEADKDLRESNDSSSQE